MNPRVVWIDETKDRRERLRRAHLRARQERLERNFYGTSRRGPVRRRAKADSRLPDTFVLLAALAFAVLLMGL